MDSHLIAGVYSQQFRETDEISLDSDRVDAINKAKRLSQETNRRRKLQAHKRQLQAKREEQRRHDILTRRRDEQRLATEKYQRSHLPPSARQNYRPVARTFGGTTLDTALQLIRGGFPHHNRPISSHERFLSLADENVDLLNSSFNKLRPHSSRPASGWVGHQLDPKERAELMNYSKQNLTASKTLFEQQLEQQQSFLLEQQQQYLNDFTNAVNSEIHGRNTFETTGRQYVDDGDAVDKVGDMLHSNSCSSIDSLDEDKSTDLNDNKFNYAKHVMSPSRHTTIHIYHGSENNRNIKKEYINIPQQQQKQELTKQQQERELDQQQQIVTSLALLNEQKVQNNVVYKNLNSFTLSQKSGSLLDGAKNETLPISDASNYIRQNQGMPHVAVASYSDAPRSNKVIPGDHKVQQNYQPPLKQFSTDSLYSGSSSNNISLMKHQGTAEKASKSSHNMPSQSIGIGNNFTMANINNNFVTGTEEANQNTFRNLYSENNDFSGQTASPYSSNIQPKQSQVAWVSPSQVESKGTPISVNEHKQINEHCKSHIASDKSALSSNTTQSQMPVSVASTNGHSYNVESSLASVPVPAPSTVSLPATFVPNSSIYTLAGSKINAAETGRTHGIEPSKDLTSAAVNNIDMKNSDASYLGISTYPQSVSQDYRNIVSNYNQKQVQIYSCLPQMNTPSIGIQQAETGEVSATDNKMSKQSSPFQNGTSVGVNSLIHPDMQNYYKQWANDNALTISAAPSYTGGSNYPVSRPPLPVTNTAIVTARTKLPAAQAGPQPVFSVSGSEITRNTSTKGLKNDLHDAAKENIEENLFVDEDSDDMRPLRGILKQTHARNAPHHQEKAPTSRPHVRDSLELAHLHNDKKSKKKKSVRFANHHGEDDNESSEDRRSERQSDVNTGLSSYKTSFDRLYPTKTASVSNSETSIRVQRALSAGAYRQQPMTSEHVQIRNDQQMSNSSVPTNSSEVISSAAYTNILQERSNLPTSFVNPLNTTPIHRPKAAAHIIMSPDTKNEASKGHNDTPSSAYKSHLETKIRPVNNNFMSKLPTKVVANKESNMVVCNAAYIHNEGTPNSYSNKAGAHAAAEDSVLPVSQDPQQQNYDKPRNAYSSLKHVSFSNVLPASKKVSYPQPNGGLASFSTSSNNVGYEKGGIRIDRTPTDDEITWLWDKVRNCLSKESGNRSNLSANGNGDQGSRQPPTFSTKLIDGTTLGLDTYSNAASDSSTNVKAGSGVFQQQTVSVTNPQNSAKAVLQPQGSYLKRYSLLKQRRANSASMIRNNTGPDGQRAGGAVYGRNSTIPVQQTSSVIIQQQVQDRPTPLMFGYKPQDEVSESTAAFIIAEKLAKQSLSDSQIQMAMEDAHSKQEAHNRSRMTVVKNGHSALSIEEQKLLESLDRLNEKLKEPGFKASMNHTQATQTQFPGFQGHRPIVDMRRHTLLTPGMLQRRAQSARPRQQTYFYR